LIVSGEDFANPRSPTQDLFDRIEWWVCQTQPLYTHI